MAPKVWFVWFGVNLNLLSSNGIPICPQLFGRGAPLISTYTDIPAEVSLCPVSNAWPRQTRRCTVYSSWSVQQNVTYSLYKQACRSIQYSEFQSCSSSMFTAQLSQCRSLLSWQPAGHRITSSRQLCPGWVRLRVTVSDVVFDPISELNHAFL